MHREGVSLALLKVMRIFEVLLNAEQMLAATNTTNKNGNRRSQSLYVLQKAVIYGYTQS